VRVEPRDCFRNDSWNPAAPIPARLAQGGTEHRHRVNLRGDARAAVPISLRSETENDSFQGN
jgi:hypothetical protein